MPLESLKKMIFPCLEETQASTLAKPKRERDVAIQAFLDLLEWFRTVILQDAVFLRLKFSSLKLWMSPPFNNVLFDEFAKCLLHEASHGQDPLFVQIANVQPLIARAMQDQHRNTLATMDTYHQSTHSEIAQLNVQMNTCLDSMRPMSTFLHRLSTPRGIQMHTQLNLVDEDIVVANMVSGSNESPAKLPIVAGLLEEPTDSEVVEQYRLDNGITTITRLWEEYDKGIVSKIGMPRGPSIRELDSKFGTKWRKQENYRKAYTRRRHIWEAIIHATVNLDMPSDIIAEKMERWQLNHGYSLQKINQMLFEVTRGASPLWGEKDIGLRHIV